MTTIEKPKTLEQGRETLRRLDPNARPAQTLDKIRHQIDELTGRRSQRAGNPPSSPADPEDMTAAQLAAAIEDEGDPVRRKALFGVLNEREAGQPRRSVVEETKGLTDLELEARIGNAKDADERAELWRVLQSRQQNRKR
jgi:hypothetical protein